MSEDWEAAMRWIVLHGANHQNIQRARGELTRHPRLKRVVVNKEWREVAIHTMRYPGIDSTFLLEACSNWASEPYSQASSLWVFTSALNLLSFIE